METIDILLLIETGILYLAVLSYTLIKQQSRRLNEIELRLKLDAGESCAPPAPSEQIVALVRAGKIVSAIKLHRQMHDTSLHQAEQSIKALQKELSANPATP